MYNNQRDGDSDDDDEDDDDDEEDDIDGNYNVEFVEVFFFD